MNKILNLFISTLLFLTATANADQVNLNPQNKQRIIVLEFSLLDELNLLGIKPVGIGTSGALFEGADPEYLHQVISTTPSVGAREAPNLEEIIKLKPSLIIGDNNFNAINKAQLEKIAPTVLLPGIFGMPDQQIQNLKTLAQLTNRQTQLTPIIEKYQKSYVMAQTQAKLGGERKILIGFATPTGQFNALAGNSITSKILNNLGKHNLIRQDTSSQLYEMSIEGVLAKNPDQIVILITNNDKSAYQNLQKNPLWQQLSAVKRQRVYFADRNTWGKSHGIQALELMYQQAQNSGFLANLTAKN